MNFKALLGFADKKENLQEYLSIVSPPKQNKARAVC